MERWIRFSWTLLSCLRALQLSTWNRAPKEKGGREASLSGLLRLLGGNLDLDPIYHGLFSAAIFVVLLHGGLDGVGLAFIEPFGGLAGEPSIDIAALIDQFVDAIGAVVAVMGSDAGDGHSARQAFFESALVLTGGFCLGGLGVAQRALVGADDRGGNAEVAGVEVLEVGDLLHLGELVVVFGV